MPITEKFKFKQFFIKLNVIFILKISKINKTIQKKKTKSHVFHIFPRQSSLISSSAVFCEKNNIPMGELGFVMAGFSENSKFLTKV